MSTDPGDASSERRKALRSAASGIASFLVLVLACAYLVHALEGVHWGDVWHSARSHAPWQLVGAVAFAAASYLALTGYDVLALRYLGRRLPYAQVGATAFMAYAIGHNVGATALSAGAVRYRRYSALGLTGNEIARVIVFCTLTFALGGSTLLGAASWLLPPADLAHLRVPLPSVHLVGGGLVAAAVAYLLLCAFRARLPLGRGRRIEAPSVSVAFGQLVLATLELSFAAATLYILLPPHADVSFAAFLGTYLLALAAGLTSSVPGGLGVFEAVLIAGLAKPDNATLLGDILVYRFVYYLLPLVAGGGLFAGHEWLSLRARRRRPISP